MHLYVIKSIINIFLLLVVYFLVIEYVVIQLNREALLHNGATMYFTKQKQLKKVKILYIGVYIATRSILVRKRKKHIF